MEDLIKTIETWGDDYSKETFSTPEGEIVRIRYLKGGYFHREDAPAIISFSPLYSDTKEEYYVDGKLHREGGPAIVHWNGSEQWAVDGFYHRSDGPALKFFYPDSKIPTQIWIWKGDIHRDGGPAIITSSGGIEFWYGGERIENDEGLRWEWMGEP